MNGDISFVQALLNQYNQALSNLYKQLEIQKTRRNVTTYTKTLIRSTKQEIAVLNDFCEKWALDAIPDAYEQGINQAYTEYRQAHIDLNKVAANQRVLKALVENAIGTLHDTNNYFGRRMIDEIRTIGLEATTQKIARGQTVKQMQKALLERLTSDGQLNITDKNGRLLNPEAYAKMVARTTTREATNTGILQQVRDIGRDLVQISTIHSTCPICAVYEGRVYSISGRDKRYPPLSKVFRGGYKTIHPNCKHHISPYIEENDDYFRQTLQESNRKFEITKKEEASIDRYNADQAKKTARRNDRKEWEAWKKSDAEKAPKTFSAYRSKKRASERRKALANK
ncbi:MAG: phage minor capsid protein [Candidatus Paceibacterota bacterium]|jgi:hypothetical protein